MLMGFIAEAVALQRGNKQKRHRKLFPGPSEYRFHKSFELGLFL